ncbi:hypothetical protein B4U79_17288 [Dinothrombium tinctorium]|uniref:VWFC domain-containing protein n=1 Tax=Dinothrombium tinctorium TaxID=1965070 RepID=A0A3S3NZH9_9ACAR|nr:hypothetical protein B4U79_16367 [Dinothrombium tinctorium]RWS11328.1 hypothetical protein B4U79_17540 [Dinothrombium tinctorium]RWS14464.1 hypothetical protein B4U79_17288 [Dinothrombium tinctorium]
MNDRMSYSQYIAEFYSALTALFIALFLSPLKESIPANDQLIGDDNKNENPLITFLNAENWDASDPKNANKCKSGNRVFANGATWHPIMGPFGPMDCVNCKCVSGNIQCARIDCIPAYRLPCNKPKRLEGQCCPSCPELKRGKNSLK